MTRHSKRSLPRAAAASTALTLAALAGCVPAEAPEGVFEQDAVLTVDRSPACCVDLPPPARPEVIDPAILRERRFGEAPSLAAKVRAGQLPPVAERLPDNPLVVTPIHEIGTYGGTLRRSNSADVGRENVLERTLSENLLGWERPIPQTIEPNLAEDYEFQDDGRTVVFRLRRGLRWSDGHPFTADDILFWYEDMQLNDDARVYPFFSPNWTVDGEPLRMEKVDGHTLRISSHKPLGRIREILTDDIIAYPKHILAPLHPRYNPEATYADFRRATTAAQLVYEPGIPRLSAWVPTEWRKGQRVVYERNPYYWKIDTAGNQLPYADRLVFEIIPNSEIVLFKFINGEIDLIARIAQGEAYPTLKAYEQHRPFCVYYAPPVPQDSLNFNWDAPDPRQRKAFRNRDVRIALSHAINRAEISAIAMHGLMLPSGYALGPTSPYHNPDQFYRYAEYDPDLARHLLDKAGYTDRNGDGWRQYPDGGRFEITIDVESDKRSTTIPELVREHWEAVGVRTHLNIAHSSIVFQRRLNARFEVLDRGFPHDIEVQAEHFGIMGANFPFWHPRADREGPEWLHEATAELRTAFATIDPDERRAHFERVRDLHNKHIPMIGIGAMRETWAASDRLGNVPCEAYLDGIYRGWERPLLHEQIFIRDATPPR